MGDPLLFLGIGFILLIILILIGFPIAVAGGIVGLIGLYMVGGLSTMINFTMIIPYSEICVYSYTVVAVFILMGSLLALGGIADDMLDVSWKWLGRVPGGPAVSTVVTGAFLGAACGSALAASAILAKLCVPAMRRYKYPDSFSCGCVAASANLSPLIPPSTLFILYGVMTQQSISKLLIAGIFPGILMAIVMIFIILLLALWDPRLKGRAESISWYERLRSLSKMWGIMLTMGVIMGGLYSGFATPTEVGSLGCLVAIIIGAMKKRLSFQIIYGFLKEAVITTSRIFIIVVGVVLFSRFLIVSGSADIISSAVIQLPLPKELIFGIMILIYFILGMLMDGVSILVLSLPMLYPIVLKLGYDPIWFGVIVIIMIGIGFLTPPVALNVFVVKSVLPEVPLEEIYKGVWPFVFGGLITVGILLAFPQIVLFLPSLM